MLIQLYHSIHIDLSHPILVRASIRCEVLGIDGRLLTQPLQQLFLYFWFSDQPIKCIPIGRLDVRDEGSGIREELGLRDEFPWFVQARKGK